MAWISTVSASGHFGYLYARIYQLNVEDFVIEIHHGDILIYFPFCLNSANSKKLISHTIHRVVRKNLNYGLRVCRIFSLSKLKSIC